ncbi:MAG: c-type cytochrome [Candidatus Tyrphobacter sp.]
MKRVVCALLACCTCTLLVLAATQRAYAIPVFANGQGVSCEECHTTFPGMTRYGMMVMMTNFQTLNRKLQDQALPFAVRAYVTSYLANKSQPGSLMVSDLSLLGGGFLGRNFTWYVEQHVIDTGQIGDTEQMWLSWNGLFHGTNSLQLGKFHTPFPFMPAHAWTLGNYLLATQTTGQNLFNPNDARWGMAFNGMSNEFMYNFSYLTGSGPTQGGLDYNPTMDPRTLDANISYGGMSQPWSIGLVGMRGFAPLHTALGTYAGNDPFTREGIYYGYQTDAWHLQTMYYHGFDAQPAPTEFDVPLNGFMFEIERDLGWQNHVLLRYDVADSDTLNRQYVLDISHNILPNVALIGEVLASPDAPLQIGFQLASAGPYEPGKRFLFSEPDGVTVVPVGASVASAAPGPSGFSGGSESAGAQLVAQSGCTGCHGATFGGGIGPRLFGIEHVLTPDQIAAAILHPHAPMPNFGFTNAQVADIIAYLSSLDGGAAGTGPTIEIAPENPTTTATVTIRFPGGIPAGVTAVAIMHMGPNSTMQTAISLHPGSDPHTLVGTIHFYMSGPYVIDVRYGSTTIEHPVQVGGAS